MIRTAIFLYFLVLTTLSLHWGLIRDLAWLLPLFLVMYVWAEDIEETL